MISNGLIELVPVGLWWIKISGLFYDYIFFPHSLQTRTLHARFDYYTAAQLDDSED